MPTQLARSSILMGVWVLVVALAGTWVGHWLFHGGKALADVTSHKSINAPVDLLAKWCRGARYADFHRIGLLVTALAGLVPFLPMLCRRDGRYAGEIRDAWDSRHLWYQAAAALLIALFFAFLATGIMDGWTAFRFPDRWGTRLLLAFGTAALFELILRGVVWREISAVWSPRWALPVVSLAHVLLMLCWTPPGIGSWDPVLSSQRFGLFPAIASGSFHGTAFREVVMPVLFLALGLGAGRRHGRSLWLTCGAHAGFLFACACVPSPFFAALGGMCAVATLDGRPWKRVKS